MADAYSEVKEWPKMLYRPAAAGGIEKRIFSHASEIPEGQGWGDSATARANAQPAPEPRTRDRKHAADLEQRLEVTNRDLAEITNAYAREQAASHDLRNSFHQGQTRIADLEGFVALVAKNEALPKPVRDAAQAVLSPEPPPEAEPRRRKIKRASDEE